MDATPHSGAEVARYSAKERFSRSCALCGETVPLGSPHLRVDASSIELFCSARCLAARATGIPPTEAATREPRSKAAATVFAIGVGMVSLSPCLEIERRAQSAPLEKTEPISAAREKERRTALDKRPLYGPPEPTEEEIARNYARRFGFQRWVHPLPGPKRRMPLRRSRAFGAPRPGQRPHECRSGHCGVDIGGKRWGEPVMATHEGVVDRINRTPDGNGGLYIRLSHRGGTVFTQYFHLAAIAPRVRRGSRIDAGEVVGLLGETGVDNSGPHLHFTISVKPAGAQREIYIDPEPLIALWPVREGPRVSAAARKGPGVPVGVAGHYKGTLASSPAL